MNRVEFFDLLPADMPLVDRMRVQWAYALAKKWFDDKERDSGERYFEHLRNVTRILIEHGYGGWKFIVRGLMHDTAEDTCFPVSMLEQLFGADTARGTLALSKSYGIEDPFNGFVVRVPKKTKEVYFAILERAGIESIVVKFADRFDNLTDLSGDLPADSPWTPERRLEKAAETRQWIIPLAERYDQRFARELSDMCTMVELRCKPLMTATT